MLVVQGSVTAAVTPINLDDVDSVLSAPGDLTVVDEEGESEPLTTYGKEFFGVHCRNYQCIANVA